jgi:hypothetical protein
LIDFLTSLVVNSIVVAVAVIIHYEFLLRLTKFLPRLRIRHRSKLMVSVFVALVAHSIEVWVFAVSYFFMHHSAGWGRLEGSFDGSLLASAYYSFTTFTTLGFGDIQPIGDIRYLTGVESLTGLVLITWTASFLFIEMQKYWNPE